MKSWIVLFRERLESPATQQYALMGLSQVAYNVLCTEKKGAPISLPDLNSLTEQLFTLANNVNRQVGLCALDCLEAFTERYSEQYKNNF